MPGLFDALTVGELRLPNRIVMSPLTRSRATGGARVPNALMAEYYTQRASAGLIISEATSVTPMGVGYADTPGAWSPEQVEGWKRITAAVHGAAGRMLLQLWHVGRVSDPSFLGGALPVAPSAIAPRGHVNILRPERPYVIPRALEICRGIPGIVQEAYRTAARRTPKRAGFDGVEIHTVQTDTCWTNSSRKFLEPPHRMLYGGSIENRARLMLEVADAVNSVWGPGRVGMHLAPRGDAHAMGDSDPASTFGYVARELARRRIAFLCLREALGPGRIGPLLKSGFGGVLIANEKFTMESAGMVISSGEADAVAFGKLFIANPDLPRRFELRAKLNEPRPHGPFTLRGLRDHTDYPKLSGAN